MRRSETQSNRQEAATTAPGAIGNVASLPIRWELIQVSARCWIVIGSVIFLWDLLRQTSVGWTNGVYRALGDDFINYWSGAVLAWTRSASDVYAWRVYHAFQASVLGVANFDFYYYSYPPVLLVLTAPLAAIPYLPALAAWLVASWYAFYRALCLALPVGQARLLAAAAPAVFVNAIGGQNGTWTAAMLGGGLCLLDRRPFIAGLLMGLLVYKPHLGMLLPIALLAGRRWWAFAGASVAAGGLIAISVLIFGLEIWGDYWRKLALFRQAILEDGTGVWHRMVSVFVFARRLGADVPLAYAVQAIVAVLAAAVVAYAWWRDAAAELRNTLLVLGTCLVTPYLQDYDLVVGAFVVAWLAGMKGLSVASQQLVFVVSSIVLILPILTPSLANPTGIAFGAVFLIPAFAIAAYIGFAKSAQQSA